MNIRNKRYGSINTSGIPTGENAQGGIKSSLIYPERKTRFLVQEQFSNDDLFTPFQKTQQYDSECIFGTGNSCTKGEHHKLEGHTSNNNFDDIASFLSLAIPSPIGDPQNNCEIATFTEEIPRGNKENRNNTTENMETLEKDSLEMIFNVSESANKPAQYLSPTPENRDIDSLPVYRIGNNFSSCSQSNCPLCLRGFEEGQLMKCLPCGHKFHLYCIDPWLLWVRKSCPEDALSIFTEKEEKFQSAEKESFEPWEGMDERFETDVLLSPMMVVGQPIRERMAQAESEAFQDMMLNSPRRRQRSKRCPLFP